jgi:16S rRNA (guanine(966)-N(2))-methyltransferase RsmD
MRIIAGKLRNRTLRAASNMRPTSDRVRETLFNILQNEIEDSIFVDAFAGSGAVGIEAISRGAAMVYFLEMNRKSLKVLESNLEDCCETEKWRIYSVPVQKSLEFLQKENPNVDILFFDPPYDFSGYAELLERSGALFPNATHILESSSRTPVILSPQWNLEKERKIGETRLSFFRLQDQ